MVFYRWPFFWTLGTTSWCTYRWNKIHWTTLVADLNILTLSFELSGLLLAIVTEKLFQYRCTSTTYKMANISGPEYGNNLAHPKLSKHPLQIATQCWKTPFGQDLSDLIGPFTMMVIGNIFIPLVLVMLYHISPIQKFYPILVMPKSMFKLLVRIVVISVFISVAAVAATCNGETIQSWIPTELVLYEFEQQAARLSLFSSNITGAKSKCSIWCYLGNTLPLYVTCSETRFWASFEWNLSDGTQSWRGCYRFLKLLLLTKLAHRGVDHCSFKPSQSSRCSERSSIRDENPRLMFTICTTEMEWLHSLIYSTSGGWVR